MSLKILIADDHPLFRTALRETLASLAHDIRFIECESVASLVAALERHPDADLLLLDLYMPQASGFAALAYVRGSWRTLPVVVVSALDDVQTIEQALALGAQGFISKSTEAAAMAADVARVLDGEICIPRGHCAQSHSGAHAADLDIARRVGQLTGQQFRVLGMVCSGLLNKQIAYALNVSEATVKAHLTAIFRKLGVGNRTHAVLLVNRLAAIRVPSVSPEQRQLIGRGSGRLVT